MIKVSEFTDAELGIVRLRVNPQARRVILRAMPGGVLITASPYTSESTIRQLLEQYRESLKRMQQQLPVRTIDLQFRIEAPLFKLSLVEGKQPNFFLREEAEKRQIICPPGTDFSERRVQEWLHKVIEECMRKQAKQLFPGRLKALAQQHGLTFNSVRISSSQGRWGSCSGRRSINLSYFLLLLPTHLIDYVMLHELAHTVEMNHGERFWALLDKMTQGEAHRLRKELQSFSPSF